MSNTIPTLEQRMSTITSKLEICRHPGLIYSSFKGSVHFKGTDGYQYTLTTSQILQEAAEIAALMPSIIAITDGDTTDPKWNEYCERFNNYIYANDKDVTTLQDRLLQLGIHGTTLFTLPNCIATLFAICSVSGLFNDNTYSYLQTVFHELYKYIAEGGERPVKVRTQAEIQAARDEWFSEFIIKPRKSIIKTIIKTIKTILTGEK